MKIFIWENINKLTDNWHSEGGLVVIAQSLLRAKKLAQEKGVIFGKKNDKLISYQIIAKEEKVFIFPNAGCC